ncbi:alanine racemase [Frankia sp. R43]|uniref:alanine racemase n=1 Tax=Frankia sp. R43 TaxID=269536 RepID=UPI0006CA4667|nr:alanine racemase [Frankia sp. R43]KPM51621.1 alanine racemase [Frankia sp. R43]
MTPATLLQRTGTTGPTLTLDVAAVTANVRTISAIRRQGGARGAGEVMAVVKADGYGHGLADVARAALAGGATRFGVTSVAEAYTLRDLGFTEPVLSWLNPVNADFTQATRAGVELAVPSHAHLRAVARQTPGAGVHLQLDTGMARDGTPPEQWESLCHTARCAERAGFVRVVGVMGHLACAAEPGHPANRRGRECFDWGVRVALGAGLRPRDRHLAATAATLSDPRTHHSLSRIGAGLVGIDESGRVRLRPALRLTAPLVTVRTVPAGTAVGYGHTWTSPRATRLGLVPVGYADGLPRCVAACAQVQVAGVRRRVVGRLSMDMTVIDLGPDPAACPARAGDVVTLFGPGDGGEPTAADWARWAGTLEHEIVTGLGPRLRRVVTTHTDPGERTTR